MPDLIELVELSKAIAIKAGLRLLDSFTADDKNYVHSLDHPKEIKAFADAVLDKEILEALAPAGLPILSEEAGYIPGLQESEYRFIVDPLDGTFNFVKGLGPSAVSIALWKGNAPVFGVIYSLAERKLIWGGDGMGAHCDGNQIMVSETADKAQASLCTGFPVRFDLGNETFMQDFWREVKPYAKVRMLGSAAVSLVNVARGYADAYLEKNIMLWDVAAGLAIVEGAGGRVHFRPGTSEYSLDVYASNRLLFPSAEFQP